MYAEYYGLNLYFLPSYSPNLNLIERLWKFTKKKLVHNQYYEKFSIFKKEVEKFFENIGDFNSELKTLITPKFEILNLEQYIIIKGIGSWNIELQIDAKNNTEFHEILKSFKNQFNDKIKNHETLSMIQEYKLDYFPF